MLSRMDLSKLSTDHWFNSTLISSGISILILSYVYYKLTTQVFYHRDLSTKKKSQSFFKSDLPPVFPNGWIPVAYSSTIKNNNKIHQSILCGNDIILYRDENENVVCLDAYCPHLGANIAYGGDVITLNDKKCVKCPFHGWTFDKKGDCVYIPYSCSKDIPRGTSIKNYKVTEVNGYIYVWYHADDEEPSWHPERLDEITSNEWRFMGRTEHIVSCHFQEIPENGADVAHLNEIHQGSVINGSEVSSSKWLNNLINKLNYHEWYAVYDVTEEELENEYNRGTKKSSTIESNGKINNSKNHSNGEIEKTENVLNEKLEEKSESVSYYRNNEKPEQICNVQINGKVVERIRNERIDEKLEIKSNGRVDKKQENQSDGYVNGSSMNEPKGLINKKLEDLSNGKSYPRQKDQKANSNEKHSTRIFLKKKTIFFGFNVFEMKLKIKQVGPTMVYLKFRSNFLNLYEMDGVFIQSIQPLEPFKHKITHHLFTSDNFLRRALSKLFLYGEATMLERDIYIWNHKKFLKKAFLLKNEKSVVKYRKWFQQFYSPSSPTIESIRNSLDW